MRSFIAVELSAALRDDASSVVGSLSPELGEVRWVSPHLMHVTLRFLGEIDGEIVPGLTRALEPAVSSQESFPAGFNRVGWFPPRGRARVIWLGFGTGNEEFVKLGRNVDDALAGCGFPPENRPFTPHVTIGRARRATISTRLLGDAAVDEHLMTVDAVTLIESCLSPSGPRYSRLARYPLAGSCEDTGESTGS